MSMLPPSLRNGSDAMPAFANSFGSVPGFSSSRSALCIVAGRGQCLSVRITLVRNTDSFRLS
jgi:hypothetical protein